MYLYVCTYIEAIKTNGNCISGTTILPGIVLTFKVFRRATAHFSDCDDDDVTSGLVRISPLYTLFFPPLFLRGKETRITFMYSFYFAREKVEALNNALKKWKKEKKTPGVV